MSDNSESENEEITEEEIQFFKDTVQQFLKLQDEITTLEKALKDRKSTKKKLSDTISLFLNEKDISHINLQGNYSGKQIKQEETVKTTNISFKNITEIIFNHFENIDDAKVLIDKLNSNRTETKSSKLKIAKPSKNKKGNSETLSNIMNNSSNNSNNEVEEVPEHMKYLYTTTIQNND